MLKTFMNFLFHSKSEILEAEGDRVAQREAQDGVGLCFVKERA